jgi:centromeric protein E
LNAQKTEVVDTEALIERYEKEIEDLKQQLEERENEAEMLARMRRFLLQHGTDSYIMQT